MKKAGETKRGGESGLKGWREGGREGLQDTFRSYRLTIIIISFPHLSFAFISYGAMSEREGLGDMGRRKEWFESDRDCFWWEVAGCGRGKKESGRGKERRGRVGID